MAKPIAPIKWHKHADNYPTWFAEIDGKVIAWATQSGRPGVDNYPWDVYNEEGSQPTFSFVTDTLRSAKERVENEVRKYNA